MDTVAKTATDTGAGSGVGCGTAKRLAGDGARAVVTEGAAGTVDRGAAAGAGAVARGLDVTDLERVDDGGDSWC